MSLYIIYVLSLIERVNLNYILKIISFLIGITNFICAISFAKKYGGEDGDVARSIQQTNDGGYIVAGYTSSFGAGGDFLVIKSDSEGNIEWAKTFGGINGDGAYSIQQTNDRGYIVAGTTNSFGIGYCDFLVIKLNLQGNIDWVKTFGGVNDEYAFSIQQTNDGGYIVAGYTSLGYDFLVIKLTSQGDIEWTKTFGREMSDVAYSVQQTNDGGYIVAGYTQFYASEDDFLVIKINSQGEIEWAKIFGGVSSDVAFSIKQTNDGGYIVTGWTNSFGAEDLDCLVIKLTPQGNIEWAKTIGGPSEDVPLSIQQTHDGGYIVVGETYSFGAGNEDLLVIKLDSQGNIELAKTFGGGNYERARSVQQTSDGGYIIAGTTSSFGLGYYDFLVIKTQDGQMVSDCPWYDCDPIVTSQNVFVADLSINVTSPILSITSPPISISLPAVSTSIVCSPAVEENIYFTKENIKVESSIFFKDKISLTFSGYSREEIKLVLYDVSGKEIISKSFRFNNYVEIRDKRIEKIKKGIYFLKVYLKSKEIVSLKIIKE